MGRVRWVSGSALESPTSPQPSPPPRGGEGACCAGCEIISKTGWRSRRARAVAEGEQQLGHVVIEFGRWPSPGVDPVEQLGIGAFEQCLESVELRHVEAGEMGFGKRAEDQIGLARAAVPGAEQQPLAANVGIGFRHDLLDIAILLGGVSLPRDYR